MRKGLQAYVTSALEPEVAYRPARMREFGAEKGPDLTDKPWACPVCNRGIAPGVTECSHGGADVGPPHDEDRMREVAESHPEVWRVMKQRIDWLEEASINPDIERVMDDNATELYAD